MSDLVVWLLMIGVFGFGWGGGALFVMRRLDPVRRHRVWVHSAEAEEMD